MVEGITIAVVGGVISGLILWRFRGWMGEGAVALPRSPESPPKDAVEAPSDAEHDDDVPEIELEQVEIVAALARVAPDEWLPEWSISRRVNLRLKTPLSRQAVRFHLEELVGAGVIDEAEPEEGDDERFYQLSAFGREFAVRMGLVASPL